MQWLHCFLPLHIDYIYYVQNAMHLYLLYIIQSTSLLNSVRIHAVDDQWQSTKLLCSTVCTVHKSDKMDPPHVDEQ